MQKDQDLMNRTHVHLDDKDCCTESSTSSVFWSPILAGAATASAISLVLIALGSGLGFSSISLWPGASVSAKSLTIMAVVWLIVVQWIASGFGGYLTGRLRTKWTGLHTHEVFFRDTAHGFLAWAMATLFVAFIATSTAFSIASEGTRTPTIPMAYHVDNLFHSDHLGSGSVDQDLKAEATRIFVVNIGIPVPIADRSHLIQMVTARTGLSEIEAEKRVDSVIADEKASEEKARELAEETRKAVVTLSFFAFLSLLIGAFISSTAAAVGGQHRDASEVRDTLSNRG